MSGSALGAPPAGGRRGVHWLAHVVRHPVTSLLTGLGLLLGGALELLEDLVVEFDTIIAAYHGVILLGLVMALRGFADFVEGVERLSRRTALPQGTHSPAAGNADAPNGPGA